MVKKEGRKEGRKEESVAFVLFLWKQLSQDSERNGSDHSIMLSIDRR
jgi:hypothetical protein